MDAGIPELRQDVAASAVLVPRAMRPLRRLPVMPFTLLGLSLGVSFADAIVRPRQFGYLMVPTIGLVAFLWLLMAIDRRR